MKQFFTSKSWQRCEWSSVFKNVLTSHGVFSIPVLRSGGPGFRFLPEDKLYWHDLRGCPQDPTDIFYKHFVFRFWKPNHFEDGILLEYCDVWFIKVQRYSKHLWNVGVWDYTVQCPRTLSSSYSPPCQPDISLTVPVFPDSWSLSSTRLATRTLYSSCYPAC